MRYEEGTNFVKFAREVAATTWDWQKREHCRQCADELQDAIKQFERTWSLNDMRVLTGAFTRCFWAVDLISPGSGGDLPTSGRKPVPEMQKVATA